jgi:hypothetical protein
MANRREEGTQARDVLGLEPYAKRLQTLARALPELKRPRSVSQLLRRPTGGRFTRVSLADASGLKRWRVDSILGGRGRMPNLLELLILSRALGCTVDALSVALVGTFVRRFARLMRRPLRPARPVSRPRP